MTLDLEVDSSCDRGFYGQLHTPAIIIGGICALFALALSGYSILKHLRSYTNPSEQKWILGVLVMVPVYATDSIISLCNPRLSVLFEILRSCYEAFALYCFVSYLVACLGGEARVVELLESESEKQLSKPLMEEKGSIGAQHSCLSRNFILHPCALGEELYKIVKFGIVQYMILKNLCAVLALTLEIFGIYGDGEFKWYYGYPYMAAVLNFSQMWALYCLVQFYKVTHQRLQSIRPLAKFISFKAIVFATWWQGVGIALLCSFGILPRTWKFQKGLQDFLICIEMAIAAVAHVYVFSAEPYHYLLVSNYGKVTAQMTEATSKVDNDRGKPPLVDQKEIQVQAPGTSVTESVQDVILAGGEHVVKDVVLTVTKAIEPVEKGVTKIQKRFRQISIDSDQEEKSPKVVLDEHAEEVVSDTGSHDIRSDSRVATESNAQEVDLVDS